MRTDLAVWQQSPGGGGTQLEPRGFPELRNWDQEFWKAKWLECAGRSVREETAACVYAHTETHARERLLVSSVHVYEENTQGCGKNQPFK